MNNKSNAPELFNRKLVKMRRARQARHFHEHDFLHQRAMTDIVDRLETVKRNFSDALFYGVGDLENLLTPGCSVEDYHIADMVPERFGSDAVSNASGTIIFDEEKNGVAPENYDLIVSLLTLHSVNDLVGALVQYRQCLKPDGFFVAAMFGGATLGNLKRALMQAELEVTGGVAQRFHPFADVKDLGQALARAGFTMPVTDIDSVKVSYKDPMRLFSDLRAMGETNCLLDQPPALRRDVLFKALSELGLEGSLRDGASKLTVDFEIIYLTGWAPHPDQQKPLKPGSAKVSMADLFKK